MGEGVGDAAVWAAASGVTYPDASGAGETVGEGEGAGVGETWGDGVCAAMGVASGGAANVLSRVGNGVGVCAEDATHHIMHSEITITRAPQARNNGSLGREAWENVKNADKPLRGDTLAREATRALTILVAINRPRLRGNLKKTSAFIIPYCKSEVSGCFSPPTTISTQRFQANQ